MKKHEITRPFVWIGFTAFGTLLTATFLEISYVLQLSIITAFCAVLLLVTRLYKRTPYAVISLLTAALFFGYYSASYEITVAPYTQYSENTYSVEAEILSHPEKDNGNFYYKANVYYINELEKSTDFTIRLSHREALSAEIGDNIRCTVKLYDFKNQPGLSSKSSHLAKGCVLGGYITDHESITILKNETRSINFYLSTLRNYLERKITSALPVEEASVLSAMLIGLRDTIPEPLNHDYRIAGASHILVISGMHMAILTQFLLNALLFFGLKRRYAILFTFPAVILFMAVSGFSVSVLRSGIMQIIMLIGLLIGRKADSLNSLAIAALVLLISNPFAIGDLSLLLSFSASLGMITLSPRMIDFCSSFIQNKKYRRYYLLLITPIISSVAAVIGTLPVQIYSFGTINILSIPTSLLVLYISAWIIRIGLPTVLLLGIPALSPAAAPFLAVTGLLLRLQNCIVKYIAQIFPYPIHVSGKHVQNTVLIILVFLLLIRWICGRKALPLTAYLAAAVIFILTSVIQNLYFLHGDTKLLILDDDYAQCLAIQKDMKTTILSCKGSTYQISNFLRNNGTDSVEWLCFGTGENEIRCAQALLSDFETHNVLLSDTVYFTEEAKTKRYHYGTTINHSDDLNLEFSSYGKWISFDIYDTEIIVDIDNAGYLPESADILITDVYPGQSVALLTLFTSKIQADDVIRELPNGNYLFTNDHPEICLSFTSDGDYIITNG